MMMKKCIMLFFLAQSCLIFTQNSIIILYGCSSAGKTSIASELMKNLPGDWKYIPGNLFAGANRNRLLWNSVNQAVAREYNVIVDTHNAEFLIANSDNVHVVVALVYCSPTKLIEHVGKRNTQDNSRNHRALKLVFEEYVAKYKAVSKHQTYIDVLHKDSLKQNCGIFTLFALKAIINKFFTSKDQLVAYIAPVLIKYDCLINTGKLSIAESAARIKQELMKRLEN